MNVSSSRILASAAIIGMAISLCACTATTSPDSSPTAAARHVTLPVCPTNLPEATPTPFAIPSPASAAKQMVPFSITFAVACRYSGSSSAISLVKSDTITSVTSLVRLRKTLNSFNVIPADDGFSCPMVPGDRRDEVDLSVGSGLRSEVIRFPKYGCEFPLTPYGWYWHPSLTDPLLDRLTG